MGRSSSRYRHKSGGSPCDYYLKAPGVPSDLEGSVKRRQSRRIAGRNRRRSPQPAFDPSRVPSAAKEREETSRRKEQRLGASCTKSVVFSISKLKTYTTSYTRTSLRVVHCRVGWYWRKKLSVLCVDLGERSNDFYYSIVHGTRSQKQQLNIYPPSTNVKAPEKKVRSKMLEKKCMNTVS